MGEHHPAAPTDSAGASRVVARTGPPSGSRRRGRPQRMPYDATPFARSTVDGASRMAWLLATCRVLSPTSGGLHRDEFLAQMRGHGIKLDASRLSRWESGQMAATPGVLAGYEAVVGLPAGVLWAADNLLRRTSGRTDTLTSSRASAGEADQLDRLFELVDEGGATGGDWLRLTTEIARADRMYLPPTTWTTLCSQLIGELTRSSGLAYLRRYEAAAVLMTHPRGRGHLTKNLGLFVMDPDAQSVTPALSLLREVDDPGAGDLVLRLMSDDNAILRRGATSVAGAMAARGRFPEGADQALEQHARHELGATRTLTRRVDAIDLAVQLSPAAYQRVMAEVADPTVRNARTTRELVPPSLGRSIAEGIATYAEAAVKRTAFDPDQLLRRLVREALFHTQSERRHLAAILLSISPYGRAVTGAVLELASDTDDLVASMCWSMLRRMGHVVERSRIAPKMVDERRAGIQAKAIVALGLTYGDLDDDAAELMVTTARTAATDGLRHAAIFALSMADHRHLETLQHDDAAATSRPATWWRTLGPAIHDADVLAASVTPVGG